MAFYYCNNFTYIVTQFNNIIKKESITIIKENEREQMVNLNCIEFFYFLFNCNENYFEAFDFRLWYCN